MASAHNGMEFEGDDEMKLRAYRMYKNGELDASQARVLFGDEFAEVERMKRNDEIVENTPDADPTDDDLFF